MAETKRDNIAPAQIEEAEQDAKDPSHEKDPAERANDKGGKPAEPRSA
jgi:hypothetical protein